MLATIHPFALPDRERAGALSSTAVRAPLETGDGLISGLIFVAAEVPPVLAEPAGGEASVPVSPLEQAPPSAGTRLRRVLGAASLVSGRSVSRLARDDRGAVTAEYAVVILAAVAFAGLLVAILRSDEVRGMLLQLVQNALGSAG